MILSRIPLTSRLELDAARRTSATPAKPVAAIARGPPLRRPSPATVPPEIFVSVGPRQGWLAAVHLGQFLKKVKFRLNAERFHSCRFQCHIQRGEPPRILGVTKLPGLSTSTDNMSATPSSRAKIVDSLGSPLLRCARATSNAIGTMARHSAA